MSLDHLMWRSSNGGYKKIHKQPGLTISKDKHRKANDIKYRRTPYKNNVPRKHILEGLLPVSFTPLNKNVYFNCTIVKSVVCS